LFLKRRRKALKSLEFSQSWSDFWWKQINGCYKPLKWLLSAEDLTIIKVRYIVDWGPWILEENGLELCWTIGAGTLRWVMRGQLELRDICWYGFTTNQWHNSSCLLYWLSRFFWPNGHKNWK